MQTLQQRAAAASQLLAEITGEDIDLSHIGNMANNAKAAKNIIEEVENIARLTKVVCGLGGIMPMLTGLNDITDTAKILENAVGRASIKELLSFGPTLQDLQLSIKRLRNLLQLVQGALSAGQSE